MFLTLQIFSLNISLYAYYSSVISSSVALQMHGYMYISRQAKFEHFFAILDLSDSQVSVESILEML